MFKLLEFDGYDQYGPHIFPLELGGGNRHIKLATEMHPEIARYISNAKKIPGKSQLLIDALGAGEWWGSNRNGDYFPHDQLSHDGRDYGYQTFMHYAYPFKHHVNKDPEKAFGDRVILSSYHPGMHRVQLIVAVHDPKCQDILQRVDNGDFPDVSMGCFIAGTLVTMSDGARKPIEDIIPGDSVITHTGKSKKVKSVHVRKYKGDLYTIKAEAHKSVRCTHKHPWYAFSEESVKYKDDHSNKIWRGSPIDDPDWTHAECLCDHYLIEPILKNVIDTSETRSFARILGYYLAEGHLLRNKKGELAGIELTTNKNDFIHSEIDQLCSDYGTINPPSSNTRKNSDEAVGISIFDKDLAQKCLEYAGVYSKEKRLKRDVLFWPNKLLFEMLGAYANGDGCCSGGAIKFSTASEDLAWQLSMALPRLGMMCSVSRIRHKAGSGYNAEDTFEWVVHVGKQWAPKLAKYCQKLICSEVYKVKNSRMNYGDIIATPVRDIEAMYVETDVYNLEVEEDESYLVSGLAVHNCRVPYDQCSICGNRAKNRAQYCDDLKWRMNKILPDGRKVMAINWRPKFFDISFVLIGAEKASKVLMKVAHLHQQTVSSAELGEKYYGRKFWKGADLKSAAVQKKGTITKEVPMKVENIEPIAESAPHIKSREPELPPAAMKLLADFPLSEIFSTLAFMGIDPKPEEFQKIILVKSGQSKLAADLYSRRAVFREDQSAPIDDPEQYFSIGVEHINEKIAHILRPYIPHRSCFNDFLIARLDKYAEESPWYPNEDKSTYLPAVPLAAGLAGLYAYMKNKSAEASMTKFEKAMLRHPWLFGLLTAAGSGVLAGGINLLRPQPLGSLDTQFGTGYNPHYKTASSKKWLLPLALGPLAYMYSGVQRSRAMRGERLGRFDRFIAERPDVAAIASMIGAPVAAGKGAKFLKHLKTGSAYTDFGLFSLTSGAKLLPAALIGAMVDAAVAKKIGKIIDKRSKHGNPEGPAR